MNEIKIAIIMPIYRSNHIIKKAFEMIINQTMKDNIVLYLINDCSPNTTCEYQDIIQEYSKYINIKYFKTNERSGPGVARQIALDQLQEKYFILHDDDDYFYDKYAIEKCIKLIQENKDKKIAAIGFSYIVEYNKERTPWYLTDSSHWNNQNVLYYTDFINKYNIKMNERTSYENEDMPFHFLIPLYAELNNYEILFQKDMFLKVIYHGKDYTSITYAEDSEGREKILQTTYLRYIIEVTEYIKLYKNIISKYRNINEQERSEIIKILKSFYKYCNGILYLIEYDDYFPFSKKEIIIFEESCNFLIDLIEKNLGTIESFIDEERNEWDIPYEQIVFKYFKETYQSRCQELLERCKI